VTSQAGHEFDVDHLAQLWTALQDARRALHTRGTWWSTVQTPALFPAVSLPYLHYKHQHSMHIIVVCENQC